MLGKQARKLPLGSAAMLLSSSPLTPHSLFPSHQQFFRLTPEFSFVALHCPLDTSSPATPGFQSHFECHNCKAPCLEVKEMSKNSKKILFKNKRM